MTAVKLEQQSDPTTVTTAARSTSSIRRGFSFRRSTQAGILLCYGALIGFGITNHAPWADEVQSWLLARDLSPLGLAVHQLRYEGSPGLWQFLLWPFAHAHLSLLALNVVGGLVAFAGVALLVLASPLPLFLRAALPFTFFLAFQYSVVARPYNLLVPLVFALAMTFPRRLDRPLPFTIILCLISAVSIQMTVVAGSVFIVLLVDGFRMLADRAEFDRQFRGPLLLFVGTQAVIVAILWPTSDNVFAHGLFYLRAAGALRTFLAVTIGTGSLTHFELVNVLLLVALGVWLHAKHLLRYSLVPFLSFAAISASLAKGGPWLDGFLTLLLVFSLWIGWNAPDRRFRSSFDRSSLVAVIGLTAIVVIVQATWTAQAYSWTTIHPYGPGEAASTFLSEHHLLDDAIASDGEYWAIDIEPYLPSGRFVNLPASGAFYYWSKSKDFDNEVFAPLINRAAEVIIAGPAYAGIPFRKALTRAYEPRFAHYRLVDAVPSNVFWPGGSGIRALGLYIFVREDVRLPPSR